MTTPLVRLVGLDGTPACTREFEVWREHPDVHVNSDVRQAKDLRAELAAPAVLTVFSGHGWVDHGSCLGRASCLVDLRGRDVRFGARGVWLDACHTASPSFLSPNVRRLIGERPYLGSTGKIGMKYGHTLIHPLVRRVLAEPDAPLGETMARAIQDAQRLEPHLHWRRQLDLLNTTGH